MQKIMVLRKEVEVHDNNDLKFQVWFWAYQRPASYLCLFPKSLYPYILLISFKLGCKGLMRGKHLQNASGFLCKYFSAPMRRTERVTTNPCALHFNSTQWVKTKLSCEMYRSRFLETVGQRDTLSINKIRVQSQTTYFCFSIDVS